MDVITPLKILDLKQGSSEVEILKHNLEIIGSNLEQSGASHVSIISVMGAYRTGKSFLLDLLTRHLKHRISKGREEEEAKRLKAAFAAEKVANGVAAEDTSEAPEATPPQQEVPWRFGEEDKIGFKLADWITVGDAERISEGDDANPGFKWRPGKDKCTSGIWLWDRPLVFTDKDDRKIGVLLMDTQGAWDTTMTKAQSATIFGLTALLSSKLVFNIQNRIEEDKLDNMDYILTFAQTICSQMPGSEKPLGHLAILVRDWVNYEDGATLEECTQLMADHLDDHMNEERVPADHVPKVERLKTTFRSVPRAFGLPHPGKAVTKLTYKGEIADIDKDFMYLLNDFTSHLFDKEFPEPCAPLGTEIACSRFVQVVMNFAEAFHDNAQDMAVGLREAFVKVEMMTSKEQLIKDFKEKFDALCPGSSVVDPESLKADAQSLEKQFKDDFAAKLKPWKLKDSEERAAVQEFSSLVDEASRSRLQQNEQRVDGATAKLAASPVLGCAGYFLLSHPYFAVVGAAGGMYCHFKKWTTRFDADAFDSRVTNGIYEDSAQWCSQRWIDLQAMRVMLNRLTPGQAMEHINKATQQAGVFVTSAAANAGMAAASSSSKEPAK